MDRVLFEREQQLGQRLAANCGVDEHDDDGADDNARDVEDRTEPFPPRSSWIVKDSLRHASETKFILAGGVRRVKPAALDDPERISGKLNRVYFPRCST